MWEGHSNLGGLGGTDAAAASHLGPYKAAAFWPAAFLQLLLHRPVSSQTMVMTDMCSTRAQGMQATMDQALVLGVEQQA